MPLKVGKRHEMICYGSSDELSRLRGGYYASGALYDRGGSARGGGAIGERDGGGKILVAKIVFEQGLESQLWRKLGSNKTVFWQGVVDGRADALAPLADPRQSWTPEETLQNERKDLQW